MSTRTYTLTASRKARVDEQAVYCYPNWCINAGKWIFSAVLGGLILCGAVASRMALVAVPLSKSTVAGLIETPTKSKQHRFLTLVVILMVPYGVEFLRCLWLHGFTMRRHPWPSKIAIFLGVALSLTEVFGLCYFTIAVLTTLELSSTELILFTNGIFILPALKNFFNARQRRSLLNILALVTVMLDLGGLAWGIYKFSSTRARTALPASLLILNIAWFSPLRIWQVQPRRQAVEADYKPLLINRAERSTSTDRLTEFDDILSPSSFAGRAVLKSGLINSALKLCTVPFVSALFCHLYDVASLHHLSVSDIGPHMGSYWNYLWVNILCSFGVYMLGYFACSMGVQRQAFAIPLLLVTPVCLFLSSVHWACDSTTIRSFCGVVTGSDYYHVLIIGAFLWLGVLMYVLLYIRKPQKATMAREKDLFLIPYSYNGVFLEQYLILNREDTFGYRPPITVCPSDQVKVFLCATMYRESPETMEQYLRCLAHMYSSQRKYTSIETHIVFDDAFTLTGELNAHAQMFTDLCQEVFKEGDATVAEAVKMPYGSQMVISAEDDMVVYVHFKDTSKVKRGKRWSQMMIMSWIIDMKRDPANTYLFTCDADVCFTYSSMERLLDLMVRKSFVGGATCRVHAEGSGPVVWYQMFEYAIGHWLVKAANSVIGSVICCSGCFSVFRLQALTDVLPVFSRPTENAADYIRRDLGEDRWLSCLLLKSGWVLDYCSLAEVSTLCPESFDDFFQQRRHWFMSSFANTCALIKDFWRVRYFNYRLSVFFFAYLIATIFFTLISPSIMIWMLAGSAFFVTGNFSVFLSLGSFLLALLILYIAACLYTLPDFHRAFAKGFSYLLAIFAFVVALGSLINTVEHHELTMTSDYPPYDLDKKMGISVSLLYLIIYLGVFVVAAILHPRESYCCLQSLWYLLCLPGFNIFLITYSVCNVHKMNSELEAPDDNVGWYLRFLKYMCGRKQHQEPSAAKTLCCIFCSSADNSPTSEAVHIEEPEKADKCEGVESGDVLSGEDKENEESSDKDDEISVLDIAEQRQYWKRLVEAFLSPCDVLPVSERQKQLCHIRNGALLVFSISNILWFIVDLGVVTVNPLGFASLTLFTVIVIIQCVAMLYHRLMTIANELSRVTFIPKPPTLGNRQQKVSSLLSSQEDGPVGSSA